MKIFLIIIIVFSSVMANAQATSSDVWINEFHYDGTTAFAQSDTGEFVELVMKTTIAQNSTELAKYSIVLYSAGANDLVPLTVGKGLPYNVSSPLYTLAETVYPLSSFQQCASGTTGFTMLSKSMSILQDIPTAIALVYNNAQVVQLLSYEKAFKIASGSNAGAAAGLTSTLLLNNLSLPVGETASSQANHAVALVGTGNKYSEFTWDDNVLRTSSPCAVNSGQTLVGTVLAVRFLEINAVAKNNNIVIQWKVNDEVDVDKYEIEILGNNSFVKAGTSQKNTSNAGNYNYTINNVLEGLYRVRIKTIDVNGRFSFSNERIVKVGSRINSASVYPNPTKGNVAILRLVPTQQAKYTIAIYDSKGTEILRKYISGLQANQINMIPLNIAQLTAGSYNVVVSSGNEKYQTNLTKVE